jgi:DNA primase
MVTCPKHKGGQESSPSCGISLIDKGKVQAGTVHCFTCGYTRTFDEMVSEVFGREDKGEYGAEWLIRNFYSISAGTRGDLIDCSREPEKVVPKQIVSEFELSQYRYFHPYMYDRGLTDRLIIQFDIGYDKANDKITFPVKDETGDVIFVAKRNVKNHYFDLPKDINKPVYGLWEAMHTTSNCIVICEACFDALSCWAAGIPAVALFGTGSGPQYKLLSASRFREMVLGFDGDEAGDKGKARFIKAIKSKMLADLQVPRGKDINNFNVEQITELFLKRIII